MTALVLGAAATWAMVGLIWFVQLVHYPLLARFSAATPGAVAVEHQRRTGWVVGPPMAVEGVTALWLLFDRPDTMSAAGAWAGAVLLAVALGSTVTVQVPLHRRLAAGHDDATASRLVSGNWVRTVAWTARGVLLAGVLLT